MICSDYPAWTTRENTRGPGDVKLIEIKLREREAKEIAVSLGQVTLRDLYT